MIKQEINGRVYRLPNSLTGFQREMYVHLIDWKWDQGMVEPGHYRNQPYDAILPDDDVVAGRMPHIYEPCRAHLDAHRRHNPFRIHRHFYHMASSQAAAVNLFLPILHHSRAGAILATIDAAPADFASLAVDQLDHGYCIEYWGGNFNSAASGKGLLGDKSARAGTDADIALAYRNHNNELCLWLIEHKLLEHEFTTCGGYRSKGRTDRARHDCAYSFSEILEHKHTCYYHDVCRYTYWDITEANRSLFVNPAQVGGCPFKGGVNQLWRNQCLGLAIEAQGSPFKHAHFSVVRHPDNTALDASMRAYKDLIGDNPKFSAFTSGDVVRAARGPQDDDLERWADWYQAFYRL